MVHDVILPAAFALIFAMLGVTSCIMVAATWLYDDDGVRWMRLGAVFVFGTAALICAAMVVFLIGGWIFDYQAVTQ